jgi:hypothetical protein
MVSPHVWRSIPPFVLVYPILSWVHAGDNRIAINADIKLLNQPIQSGIMLPVKLEQEILSGKYT